MPRSTGVHGLLIRFGYSDKEGVEGFFRLAKDLLVLKNGAVPVVWTSVTLAPPAVLAVPEEAVVEGNGQVATPIQSFPLTELPN